MALQWMILTYVVAAEAAIAILLTLPSPKALKSRFVSLISLALQPSLFVVPFSAFQLLDIYWKNEHRLMCTGEICTASERDRYEKSIYKAQRNVILCLAACLLYWCICRVCKYYKEIQSIEEVEKRFKDQ
uniref:Endoplasmic reticulum transmembrane protein n=1 Tax=Solanum chacoense TaxID=4108 RepID=A0A0V0H0S6_SOLCH